MNDRSGRPEKCKLSSYVRVHPGVGINVLMHEKYTAAGFHKTIQYIYAACIAFETLMRQNLCFISVLKLNKTTNSSLSSTTEPAAMVK